MDNILLGIQNERYLVYMEDIIIYYFTIYEHLSRLSRVLQPITKFKTIKASLSEGVAYFGHFNT